jgi:hypothetical protein
MSEPATQPTEYWHVALLELARLARELRAVQKQGGKVYKDSATASKAAALEKKLDALLEPLLH